MNIKEYIKKRILYLDGGLGTLLQSAGLKSGEYPEMWNITNPDRVTEAHRAYFDAGANVVCTNTFGCNSLKFNIDRLSALIRAAVDNAVKARGESRTEQEKFIALDVGPLGKMLKPYGELDFEEAVSVFAQTVKIGAECGVDLIFIETMNDSYETKAALLAAKENTSLPVFVSNAYSGNGKLMTGAEPCAVVAMLEGMGADAIGVNCSLGPEQLYGVVEQYLKYASVPVIVKPNAGLPCIRDGCASYDIKPEKFADIMTDYLKSGVRIAGGCCGTTPEYISLLTDKTRGLQPVILPEKNFSFVSSYTHAVEFGKAPVLIGERINPTGKKLMKEALRAGKTDYIMEMAISQQDSGAHILDVNTGLPEINEAEMLKRVCMELQTVTDLPLQIDTSDPDAMQCALRCYNGKAMINSVNGKLESMRSIFPLVKKYGGLCVCLTLDESGIPQSAEERYQIAEYIVKTAGEYGISKKDLIFDTLSMAVSADETAATTALNAISLIKNRLGCNTVLGVSNISFGLPGREIITSAFFATALYAGLSAAIMNPLSSEMMKTYYSLCALLGYDKNCTEYIENINKFSVSQAAVPESAKTMTISKITPLKRAVIKGLRQQAAEQTLQLLKTVSPLDIVNNEIIPALDIVGVGFENKTFFLPQLLLSAKAAQSAFEQIKAAVVQSGEKNESRGKFVIATVQGDIHDIGKNIVKLILENYGFDVTDLGRDVPPQQITDTVKAQHAPLVGLSALMTTTVPAMEKTIKLLREQTPWVKIAVGGAVLTPEYAEAIGADFYGKDAMTTVRYAIKITENQ